MMGMEITVLLRYCPPQWPACELSARNRQLDPKGAAEDPPRNRPGTAPRAAPRAAGRANLYDCLSVKT
jgi:hypothetical protein